MIFTKLQKSFTLNVGELRRTVPFSFKYSWELSNRKLDCFGETRYQGLQDIMMSNHLMSKSHSSGLKQERIRLHF